MLTLEYHKHHVYVIVHNQITKVASASLHECSDAGATNFVYLHIYGLLSGCWVLELHNSVVLNIHWCIGFFFIIDLEEGKTNHILSC